MLNKSLGLLLCITLISICLGQCFERRLVGATYYIDATDGDDSNNGQSEDQAWQTLSKVYTEFKNGTFSGGDRILFKRGETWTADYTARLRVRNVSGTSKERPLYIGAYGIGEKPRIDARHATWSYLLGSGVDEEGVNHVIVEDLALTGDSSHSTVLDGVRGWTLRSVDMDKMIIIRRSEYVVLDSCDITSWDSEPVYIGTADDWTDRPGWIEIINCHIHDCPRECIDLKPGTHHITIEGNIIFDADNECISLRGDHHIVRNNIISNLAGVTDAESPSGRGGMGIANWRNVLGGEDTGHNHIIEGNLIKDIKGNGVGIRLAGSGHTVRNNTIVNCAKACVELYRSATQVTIRNNIFYGAPVGISVDDSSVLPDSDHNCFYALTNHLFLPSFGGYRSVARTCANNSIECNSITSDPNFLDGTDYEIDSSSPCYDANIGRRITTPSPLPLCDGITTTLEKDF